MNEPEKAHKSFVDTILINPDHRLAAEYALEYEQWFEHRKNGQVRGGGMCVCVGM